MAKAKLFKGTLVPSLAGKGLSYKITRGEIVAYVVACLAPNKTKYEKKKLRKKVADKVDYATLSGKLPRAVSGLFQLGDFGLWAALEWPGCFKELPKRSLITIVKTQQAPQTTSATGYLLPPSLTEAHALLIATFRECAAKDGVIAALQTALDEAQAKAAKNAARGRRPIW